MQAYFSGVWGLSSVIGPVIGGFITDQISWRWVFFVNLPIGVVAALDHRICSKRSQKQTKADGRLCRGGFFDARDQPFDAGNGRGRRFDGDAIFGGKPTCFFGGGSLLALFVWVETRAKDPMIPFRMFRNRTVAVSVGAGFLGGIAMFGGISFIPLFAQGSLGMTATQAGSLITPLMLSWVTMSIVGGRLLLKIGYRAITIVGFYCNDHRFCFAQYVWPHGPALPAVYRSRPDRSRPRPDDADASDRRSAGCRAASVGCSDIAESVFACYRRGIWRGDHGSRADGGVSDAVEKCGGWRKRRFVGRTGGRVCVESERPDRAACPGQRARRNAFRFAGSDGDGDPSCFLGRGVRLCIGPVCSIFAA